MAGGVGGLLLPSGFWGDGVGLMPHRMLAPQPARGSRGGMAVPPVPLRSRMGSDHLVSALGPWQPITRNFTLWDGYSGDSGGDEHSLPGGVPQPDPRGGPSCQPHL